MHYIDKGEGPETIVFSHGLLFSSEMFADQIAHFKDHYRCVAFDHRGQGQSPITKDGYDLDTLADDAIKLIEVLEIGPCHFAGLSMGAMVGMRIAVKRPDLLKSLILIDTSADGEPEENKSGYAMLNFIGRWFGFKVVVNKIMPIMFGQTFLNDPARAADLQKMVQISGNEPSYRNYPRGQRLNRARKGYQRAGPDRHANPDFGRGGRRRHTP